MYFDTRTNRALMDNRFEEARKASRLRRSEFPILHAIRERLGAWMISQGEKLVSQEPKVA